MVLRSLKGIVTSGKKVLSASKGFLKTQSAAKAAKSAKVTEPVVYRSAYSRKSAGSDCTGCVMAPLILLAGGALYGLTDRGSSSSSSEGADVDDKKVEYGITTERNENGRLKSQKEYYSNGNLKKEFKTDVQDKMRETTEKYYDGSPKSYKKQIHNGNSYRTAEEKRWNGIGKLIYHFVTDENDRNRELKRYDYAGDLIYHEKFKFNESAGNYESVVLFNVE